MIGTLKRAFKKGLKKDGVPWSWLEFCSFKKGFKKGFKNAELQNFKKGFKKQLKKDRNTLN